MNKIRLLIAEDHNIVRQGLINILEDDDEIAVVAEAESGDGLIDKYFRFKPDVALSDIKMPRRDGLDAAKKILNKDPDAKILFLSMFGNEEYIYKTHKLGAKGLVAKDILKGELISAIKIVYNGGLYFLNKSEEELKDIRKKYSAIKEPVQLENSQYLTQREKEVLRYIAEGLTSKDIAEKMFLSKRTIDSYRMQIMSKLDIHSLPKLVRYAIDFTESQEKKSE